MHTLLSVHLFYIGILQNRYIIHAEYRKSYEMGLM